MEKPLAQNSSRAVANWVLIGIFMLLVQVMLGGITRLTGSGLSITEWDVITGIIPPISSQQWITEFDKYRQTPQFHLLHSGFTLSDFKFIFFWEWFHRFWARMVGVVFIVGFVYLTWKRKMKQEMIKPLLALFMMGALQGAVGWIMVASGLTGDAIYVKPTKLAIHFVLALGLISYAFWFVMQLTIPSEKMIRNNNLRKWGVLIVAVIFFQLIFGALMAGHRGAAAAPTWPTINGDWLPASLFREQPFLLNFIDNPIAIHFMHRGIAYLLFVLVLIWTWKAYKISATTIYFLKSRWIPIFIVFLQVVLGIAAVLNSTSIIANHWGLFEWLAQAHQLTGMLFLLCMVYMLYVVRPLKN
ncbi:MAG: COX15/CtaA family protein [Bacteroidetes bacterium]|nr:COX15/CtaA family protein [Bacteroidota bacterium]MBS1973698.1 COX15/CtaA family protein [Bacteroidota bacterium]